LTLPKSFKKAKNKTEYEGRCHLVAKDTLSQWLTQLRRKIRSSVVGKSRMSKLRKNDNVDTEDESDSEGSDSDSEM
jgi:hypothetical protein